MERSILANLGKWCISRIGDLTKSLSVRQSVWILKSTFYPDFRRRILTLLSLPKDSLFEVEFDSKWIDDELKNQLKSDASALNGKDAYFVFLDLCV